MPNSITIRRGHLVADAELKPYCVVSVTCGVAHMYAGYVNRANRYPNAPTAHVFNQLHRFPVEGARRHMPVTALQLVGTATEEFMDWVSRAEARARQDLIDCNKRDAGRLTSSEVRARRAGRRAEVRLLRAAERTAALA